jgi:hypothetical protein
MKEELCVRMITSSLAAKTVIVNHYLHRKPPMSYCFGLFRNFELVGVCTFGTPPSRHLQLSVCPQYPEKVVELNRLWVDDSLGKNTESWFVTRCLPMLPARIVVSYADTAAGHRGYIYRALNWKFAGLTDEERKTPRFDYVCDGKHSRAAFRTGDGLKSQRVRRLPKYKYWTVTGNRRSKRRLLAACKWPSKCWQQYDQFLELPEAS